MTELLRAGWHALSQGAFLGTDAGTWMRLGFLLGLSAAIWYGWFWTVLARDGRAVYAVVAAQVMSSTQVLVTILVLGWTGRLRPLPLALLSVGGTLLLYWVGVRSAWSSGLARQRRVLAELRALRPPLWAWTLIALFLVLLARNLIYGWFLPPYDRDGIAYHLPIMASFAQAGAIRPINSLAERIRDFPINSELTQLWSFLFVGLDKVVDLAFLPGVVIGAVSLYGLARRFGASRRASGAGAAVFAFTPAVFLLQLGSYNDAWMASLFFMGTYLVMGSAPLTSTRSTAALSLAVGLCAGTIAGTKFSGMALAGILFLLLAVRLMADSQEGRGNAGSLRQALPGMRSALPMLLLFALGATLLAAYPYVRNCAIEGNPLAPLQVKLAGRVIWPGRDVKDFLDIGSEKLVAGTTPLGLFPLVWLDRTATLYDVDASATGPLWVFLGLPGVVFWAIRSFRKRDGWALFVAGLVLLFFLVEPANWRPRYVLAALLPASIGAALLVDWLTGWPRSLLLGAAVMAAGFIVVETLPAPILSPGQVHDFIVNGTDLTRATARVAQPNEVYQWIDSRTTGRPARIAYGRHVDTYPLFGPDLRNTILHLNEPDAPQWQAALRESRPDYVVASIGSPEEIWTRAAGEYVEVVHGGGVVVFARP